MIAEAGAARKDLLVLGLVVAAGAVLSWSSAVYPAEIPSWAPWEFSWPEYLGSILALVWYARGVLRMMAPARPALWRQIAYGIGVIGIYAVVQTRFSYLAQHLFMATQIQQFVLHDIGPFLVALSWPGAALKAGMPPPLLRLVRTRPVLAALRVVQHPVWATLLFLAFLVGQVVPAIVFRMMLDRRVFDAMNILMAVDGVLFWCLVLDPRPRAQTGLSYFARMVLAFVVMVPVMPIGAYIAFTSHALYGFYDICGRLDWVSAAGDQQFGGLILWIPGGLMSAVAVLLPLNAMRLEEERHERLHGKTLIQVGQHQFDPDAWTGRQITNKVR